MTGHWFRVFVWSHCQFLGKRRERGKGELDWSEVINILLLKEWAQGEETRSTVHWSSEIQQPPGTAEVTKQYFCLLLPPSKLKNSCLSKIKYWGRDKFIFMILDSEAEWSKLQGGAGWKRAVLGLGDAINPVPQSVCTLLELHECCSQCGHLWATCELQSIPKQ